MQFVLNATIKKHIFGHLKQELEMKVKQNSTSVISIPEIAIRTWKCSAELKKSFSFENGNLTDKKVLEKVLSKFKPDAIVHFAEIPSAPYSMKDCFSAFPL